MATVLIVEDDLFIRELADVMIQDWGHRTLLAGDMNEALSLLRSTERIDALFTDVYLNAAVLGGCELARQAVRLRPDLRVLYTTGSAVSEKLKTLFLDGAQFLSKPYTDHQLHHSLDDLLAA